MDKNYTITGATAGATTAVFDYSVEQFGNLETALVVTAASGTTPTLDVDVEISYDNVTWITTQSFTQATTTTTGEILDISKRGKFVRFTYTIGGTDTPTFSFNIYNITKKA